MEMTLIRILSRSLRIVRKKGLSYGTRCGNTERQEARCPTAHQILPKPYETLVCG